MESNKPIHDSALLSNRILTFIGSIDNMHPLPAYIVAQRPDIAELTNVDRVAITLADMYRRGLVGRAPYKDKTSPTTRFAYHGLNTRAPSLKAKAAPSPAAKPTDPSQPRIDLYYHKDGRVSLKIGMLTLTIGVEQ